MLYVGQPLVLVQVQQRQKLGAWAVADEEFCGGASVVVGCLEDLPPPMREWACGGSSEQ